MWISGKKWAKIAHELSGIQLKVIAIMNENKKLIEENADLIAKISMHEQSTKFKDQKIAELMNSVQSLNRDLDEWEPLANMIATMVHPFEEQEIKIPNAGINMLKKYQQLIEKSSSDDK